MASRKEKLGIEYIYGHLAAEVHGASGGPRRWEYPKSIKQDDLLGDFMDIIPEAIEFKGEEVSYVMATPAVQYTLLKTVPMKHKDLLRFIKHKSRLVWGKKEEYTYGWSALELLLPQSSKKELYIHLYLLPSSYVTLFLDFCRKYAYRPMHIYTAVSLAPELHDAASSATEGLSLIAATAGANTFISIGKRQKPYLIRELPYCWTDGDSAAVDRVGREIQRSILFTKQQFSLAIDGVRLMGKGAEGVLASVNEQAKIPAKAYGDAAPWIFTAVNTAQRRTENVVPKSVISQTRRKRITAGFFLVLLFFLGIAGFLEITVHRNLRQVRSILKREQVEKNMLDLVVQRGKLENTLRDMQGSSSIASAIKGATLDPVPGWFAGFAANVVPDSLVLSKLVVQRDNADTSWKVLIEGFAPRNPLQAAALLDRFHTSLTGDPPLIRIESPWQVQWIENLKSGGTAESARRGKMFLISGRIR